MSYHFLSNDLEAFAMGVTPQEIVNSLTLNDVKNFLESLGVDDLQVDTEKQIIICPTICHHPLDEEASHKLFWYHNHRVFHCYTQCGQSYSIFTLYQRFVQLNYHYEIGFEEAKLYILNFVHQLNLEEPRLAPSLVLDLEKYRYKTEIPQLQDYPKCVLDCFIDYHHPSWIAEGIDDETMSQFNIRYSITQNKIIIPHYDKDSRLIGIRGRALNEEDVELGKYKPITVGDITYSHPLQFNAYGVHLHQKAIQQLKSVVIFEGEKSVLKHHAMYGEWSNGVACCGSNINKYQISLLTRELGANEIIIALDKEYEDWNSDKARKYREKIERMGKKYSAQAAISYIWDVENLLKEKDSPIDRGQDIYEYLYQHRIQIR